MVYDEQLAARVRVLVIGPEANDKALKEPHTSPMDFTERSMKGYIYVSPEGVKTAVQLRKWLTRGQTFISSLAVAKRTVRPQRG